MNTCRSLVRTVSALGLLLAGSAYGVTFQNVPLDFSHQPSTRLQTLIDYFSDGVMDVPTEYVPAPFKPYGVPGVAIFDYDTDGDLDIYVTNGPGGANGLFSNQLVESHSLGFVDVAADAGVALTDVDTQGVCYGDIDNDSDPDLLVLGFNGAHHLFENDGDGTFTDITATSHIAGQTLNGVSCAMGDVNGDGLLDIAIANAFDFTTMTAITSQPVVNNQPNSLFLNQGGNTFTDASTTSGIRNKVTGANYPADLSWSVALVDYDEDGDVDAFFGNDMRAGAFQNTFISLFQNDGHGHFTDVTGAAGFPNGSWRGLAFGDINCDSRMDLFATNLGDYIFFPGQVPAGAFSSAWFL
ncbi:MAG TPA: VCBS repeat-containing protein, partial [Thermoanaerobaculia bacterium]|nr:VCBS repeat-containing protein [Thermoanaerobaculia bacterium]